MKNLFVITEEEKNRILGLHESATKNHYLINETDYGPGGWINVDTQTQTLYLNNYLEMERVEGKGSELKLNAGTKFTKGSSDFLIAKNTQYQMVHDLTGSVQENLTGDVFYYCKTKRFGTNKDSTQYWGENFDSRVQAGFDDLCSSLGKEVETQKQEYVDTGFRMKGVTDNKPDAGTGGEVQTMPQPAKYNQEIKDLQTKVGVKDDGILGKVTLKAIMDKLSQ
jgi:hypothetical protein